MDPATLAPPGRTAGIMQFVRQRIAARDWPPGARLPSLRGMAVQHGVSKSTVVEAYDRLATEGVIRARAGAGFYGAGPLAPLTLTEIGPRLDRRIDPLWVSRQSLDLGVQALKPGCGWLPEDWMPQDAIRRALRQVARDPAAPLTDYAPALGLPALRSLIAQHLATRGMQVDPRQILLTCLIWMLVLMFQIATRGLTPTNRTRIMCLSLFWHFLDVVWICVFTIVYLMGVM